MKDKVVSLGLGRTGTTSLELAVNKLGYTNTDGWNRDLLIYGYLVRNTEKIIKNTAKYDAMFDIPWCFLYDIIDENFKDTKFILTTRKSPDKWLDSMNFLTLDNPKRNYGHLEHRLIYGYAWPKKHPKQFKNVYKKHNDMVRNYFGDRDDFMEMCLEDGDGWEELCNFLGKDTPNIQFPHTHQKKERIYRIGKRRAKKDQERFFGWPEYMI